MSDFDSSTTAEDFQSVGQLLPAWWERLFNESRLVPAPFHYTPPILDGLPLSTPAAVAMCKVIACEWVVDLGCPIFCPRLDRCLGSYSGSPVLYLFWGSDEQLLYAGITKHIFTRAYQHRMGKSWWGDVTRVAFYKCESMQKAAVLESDWIRGEHPSRNIQQNRSAAK
jgi:hypothetical protein